MAYLSYLVLDVVKLMIAKLERVEIFRMHSETIRCLLKKPGSHQIYSHMVVLKFNNL